ncbi:hypothetical protein VISP3789_04026 [Vibrio splendidus ATCC 33789]|nr:hypothetical protein VISP3789_04026 [Vibrio splendidus ATCC 33789]
MNLLTLTTFWWAFLFCGYRRAYWFVGWQGAVALSWLNFVRDKIVLGAAKSMQPSHSKQIFFNKAQNDFCGGA